MRHGRLRRSEDVRAVLRRGRRRACPSAVVHAIDRGDGGPARVAVIASRRIGSAVRRNRAKRVLRAAAASCELPPGVDIALVARDATADRKSSAATVDLAHAIEHMFDVSSQTADTTP